VMELIFGFSEYHVIRASDKIVQRFCLKHSPPSLFVLEKRVLRGNLNYQQEAGLAKSGDL
jgi:hypothetical protein